MSYNPYIDMYEGYIYCDVLLADTVCTFQHTYVYLFTYTYGIRSVVLCCCRYGVPDMDVGAFVLWYDDNAQLFTFKIRTYRYTHVGGNMLDNLHFTAFGKYCSAGCNLFL